MRFAVAIFAAGIAASVALLGYAIYFELKHPCLRYERERCEIPYCAFWNTDPNNVTYCAWWSSYESTCSVCVERQP